MTTDPLTPMINVTRPRARDHPTPAFPDPESAWQLGVVWQFGLPKNPCTLEPPWVRSMVLDASLSGTLSCLPAPHTFSSSPPTADSDTDGSYHIIVTPSGSTAGPNAFPWCLKTIETQLTSITHVTCTSGTSHDGPFVVGAALSFDSQWHLEFYYSIFNAGQLCGTCAIIPNTGSDLQDLGPDPNGTWTHTFTGTSWSIPCSIDITKF